MWLVSIARLLLPLIASMPWLERLPFKTGSAFSLRGRFRGLNTLSLVVTAFVPNRNIVVPFLCLGRLALD
jgi:hypothetical protein